MEIELKIGNVKSCGDRYGGPISTGDNNIWCETSDENIHRCIVNAPFGFHESNTTQSCKYSATFISSKKFHNWTKKVANYVCEQCTDLELNSSAAHHKYFFSYYFIRNKKSVRTLPTSSGLSAVVRDQTEHQSNKKNYTGIAPSKSRPKNSDPIMPMNTMTPVYKRMSVSRSRPRREFEPASTEYLRDKTQNESDDTFLTWSMLQGKKKPKDAYRDHYFSKEYKHATMSHFGHDNFQLAQQEVYEIHQKKYEYDYPENKEA